MLASRRARQTIDGIQEGERVPDGLLAGDLGIVPLIVPYEVGVRRERIVYLSHPGDMSAYEELRTDSPQPSPTSCGRRSPACSRCSRWRPCPARTSTRSSTEPATRSSRRVSSSTRCCSCRSSSRWPRRPARALSVRPELDIAAAELEERASRAGVALRVQGDAEITLEMRPRMLRVIAQNLAENAIRYAGPGTSFVLAVDREGDAVVLRGADDGVGVNEEELSRLFERFYRADHARASRGTGLGLAIVKHIVGQAGGVVEARGGKGLGLEIRCVFPVRAR